MSPRPASILVVDDDPGVTASLLLLLKQAGHAARSAEDAAGALAAIARERPDLVLQDMNFSRATTGEEGLALVSEIRRRWPDLPVVLMTAWGTIDLAVRGMREGAVDFVTKPWENDRLLGSLATALALAPARAKGPAIPGRDDLDRAPGGDAFAAIAGSDPKLVAVLDLALQAARTEAPVLITGESGTGKDLLASAIHAASRRSGGPFVKVNLGGIATSVFESEMFGHVRGAFTDARGDRRGRFEMADGGTIFLDEVGDLDASSQVKLLRVLQDGSFELLGSSETRRVDVRVVSATNADLRDAMARGRFREDLYYRLNLIVLHLPPLRERAPDVPELAARFLEEARVAYGKPDVELTQAAVGWLRTQPWPGNVRQMKHLVERAVIVARRPTLDAADLSASAELAGRAESGAGSGSLPAVGTMTLDQIEEAMIRKSLAHHGGNLTRVASDLGLSRAALYRRLEKHGIQP